MSGRRFVLALAAALCVPLLLGVPVIALLKYDTRGRERANAILVQEIDRLAAQIGDIKDFDSVTARLLTRVEILKLLEPSAAQTADALSVVGRLPGDLQLRSFETRGRRLSLVVNGLARANEDALVAQLFRSRFRDVGIVRPEADKEGDGAIATVTAISTRSDTK